MSSTTYRVQGMDCTSCALKLEKGVQQLDGVQIATVDFATSKIHIQGTAAPEAIYQRVQALGYTLEAEGQGRRPSSPTVGGVRGFWLYLQTRLETRLALIGGALTLAVLVLALAGMPLLLVNGLWVLAMAISAYPIARDGLNNLAINRDFNINLLMTIAAIGAVLIGEYLEAATVIFLFAIGEALEGYTTDRARNSMRSLVELAPPHAIRLENGQERQVPVEHLHVGDHIVIKPGERMPMDGTITSGTTEINQAPITGESLPVYKTVGDPVYAGTINGLGAVEVEVTRLVQDNTLSRIIELVERAQSVRAPSQKLIDQFARWYTPMVMVAALLIASLPPLLFGAPFWGHGGWLYRALALLVIACPCSLVISAPVTILSAITGAARRGVLIKGGAYLEALAGVKAFAFDKTGTLTQGMPQVVNSYSEPCTGAETCPDCDEVYALAAAVERRSTHPIAKAVVTAAQQRTVAERYAPAADVEMMTGLGITGRVADRQVTLGSHRLFDREYPHSDSLHQAANRAEANGYMTMLVLDQNQVRGYLALRDTVRDESRQVVEDLQRIGVKTVMLTGDNATVAHAIGQQVGVDEVRADLLPEDKVNAVQGLLDIYQRVAMVGDGVNDAPALATATVGIAMGGAGSAQALETADVVLMADDLRQLPYMMRLAVFARNLIRHNILLSFAVKLGVLVLAVLGGATLWMAIAADVGISLVVTLNGMRPLRFERQP